MEEARKSVKSKVITEWVNKYADGLYTWAIHKTSSAETAEDLVQETFVSAFKSFDKFESKSSPKTYLTSILNNKIIDYYRKQARSFSSPQSDIEKRAHELSDSLYCVKNMWAGDSVSWDGEKNILDDSDFTKVLSSCMRKLPESWRSAVQAKYILEKNSKEICQDLDITPSNYWQIVHRAKLVLKGCLEKNWLNIKV